MPCNHQLYGFTNSQIHKFTIHKSTTSQPRISHLTYHIPHPESQLTHFTSSQLINFTASQIHKFTNSQIHDSQVYDFTTSHLTSHIITSSHLHIITSSHLHDFTTSQIHKFTIHKSTTSQPHTSHLTYRILVLDS